MVSIRLVEGDSAKVLESLPDDSVHCVVTSPPYFSLRDYRVDGQIGLEATLEEYIEKVVAVFDQVRRVLHPSGTLWLNVGDTYTGGGRGGLGGTSGLQGSVTGQNESKKARVKRGHSYQRHAGDMKQLLGVPWRIAFALQQRGWILRADIVWHKNNSFPESVTDRPSRSHEYVFLFSKSRFYFYDQHAIAEPRDPKQLARVRNDVFGGKNGHTVRHSVGSTFKQDGHGRRHAGFNARWDEAEAAGETKDVRNARSVWTIPTQPFAGDHFATFPEKLAQKCILAGTSAFGCCSKCGAQWKRVVEKTLIPTAKAARRTVVNERSGTADRNDAGSNRERDGHVPGWANSHRTIDWAPTCKCGAPVQPSVVLDPFCGSGTTGVVCSRIRRSFVGIDLDPTSIAMSRQRIHRDAPLFNDVSVTAKRVRGTL